MDRFQVRIASDWLTFHRSQPKIKIEFTISVNQRERVDILRTTLSGYFLPGFVEPRIFRDFELFTSF